MQRRFEQTAIYRYTQNHLILAKQAHSGRAQVAPEICGKSYNSSRDEYYYGVKLHAFAQRNPGGLPLPKALMIAPAPEHDLTVAKQIMRDFGPISCGTLYADKACIDDKWKQLLHAEYDIQISTPRKKRRGDTLLSGDAFSTYCETSPAESSKKGIIPPFPQLK